MKTVASLKRWQTIRMAKCVFDGKLKILFRLTTIRWHNGNGNGSLRYSYFVYIYYVKGTPKRAKDDEWDFNKYHDDELRINFSILFSRKMFVYEYEYNNIRVCMKRWWYTNVTASARFATPDMKNMRSHHTPTVEIDSVQSAVTMLSEHSHTEDVSDKHILPFSTKFEKGCSCRYQYVSLSSFCIPNFHTDDC